MENDKSKKIILLPIYNESKTLGGVLEKLRQAADLLIMVNDGSTDNSGEIASRCADGYPHCRYLGIENNAGKSEALKRGFERIIEMAGTGEFSEEDVIIITDADGQIPTDIINDAFNCFTGKDIDMLIACRDFSKYPVIKKIGNIILSKTASILAGFPFDDTQCGFRMMTVSTLKKILPFYRAKRYSCEQELSMIPALLGLKIDNSYKIEPVYYRSNSTYTDAFRIAYDSLKTAMRVKFRKNQNEIR